MIKKPTLVGFFVSVVFLEKAFTAEDAKNAEKTYNIFIIIVSPIAKLILKDFPLRSLRSLRPLR